MAAPDIDGSTLISATSGTSATVALTTTQSNDIIGMFVVVNGARISSISSSNTTGWAKRARSSLSNPNDGVEIWYGKATSPLTAESFTINFDASTSYISGCAFGVSGANFSTIFDVNASLPNMPADGTFPADPRTVSTTATETLIIGCFRQAGNGTPSTGAGFTGLQNSNFGLLEYKRVTSVQTSLSVPDGAASDANGAIGDAIVAAGPSTYSVSVAETAAATEAYVVALKIYPHWLKVAPRVSYSNLRNAGRSDLVGGAFHYSIFEKLRSATYNDGPTDSVATSDTMSGIKTNLVRITGGFGSFLNTDGVNWAGLTLRVRFETSLLAANNGGDERVSFVFLAGTSGSIAAAYIGHAAASGDPYDFDGSQVQLKFDGGSTTKVLSGAATVVSDYAPTFAYDPTKPLIVSIAFTGTQINLAGY